MNKRKQTILIAEDNDINREILSGLLGDEYDVIEAVNGQETIALLQQYEK